MISQLLILLSPHFLRKETFQVMEWLIRRFNIHEMNINAVMGCILPYHETKQFAKVVQVLAIPSASMWSFLAKSVQKSKVPLDRGLMVDICIKDASYLKFILEMGKSAKTHAVSNRTLTSFIACILIQYLDKKSNLSDAEIRIILPSMAEMTGDDDKEVRSAGQMIIAFLSTKATFTKEMFSGLFSAVTVGLTPVTLYASVMCLVTMSQNQQKLDEFPDVAFHRIVKTSGFETVLSKIGATYDIEAFVWPFFRTLLKTMVLASVDHNRYVSLFSGIISRCYLNARFLKKLVTVAIRAYIQCFSKETQKSSNVLLSPLRQVYDQNVTVFDEVTESLFKECTENSKAMKKQKEALCHLITSSFKGTSLELVGDGGTTLFLSLHHPSADVRLMGLQKLHKLLLANNSFDFVSELLLTRLRDQESTIILFILNMQHLENYVSIEKLASAVAELLSSAKPGSQVAKAAVTVMLKISKNKNFPNTCLEFIFGLFWIDAKKDKAVLKCIEKNISETVQRMGVSSSCGAKLAEIFSSLNSKQDYSCATAQSEIVSLFAAELLTSTAFKDFVLEDALKSGKQQSKLLAMRVLQAALANTDKFIFSFDGLLEYLIALLSDLNNEFELDPKLLAPFDASRVPNSGLATYMLLSLVSDFITKVSKPVSWLNPGSVDETARTSKIRTAFEMAMVISNESVRSYLVPSILTFVGARDLIEFMTSCWIYSPSKETRAVALSITTKFIAAQRATKSPLYDFQVIVTPLLLGLSDSVDVVRSAAIKLLECIAETYSSMTKVDKVKTKNLYGYDRFYGSGSSQVAYLSSQTASLLVDKLHHWKEEIFFDAGYLASNISSILRKRKDKSDEYHEDRLIFLLSNILAIGNVHAQTRLLAVLQRIDSPVKLKTLYPLLEKQLTLAKHSIESAGSHVVEEVNINMLLAMTKLFTGRAVASLFPSSRSSRYVKGFCDLLTLDASQKVEPSPLQTVSLSLLEQITSEWMKQLDIEHQKVVFSALLNLLLQAGTHIATKAKAVLSEINISSQVILPNIEHICKLLSVDDAPVAKRPKSATVASNSHIKAGICLMELLQSKNDTITDFGGLIMRLFDVISVLLNFNESYTQAEVEYLKQLTLSVLQNFVSKQISSLGKIQDCEKLRIDLIVQCIRVTDNPQTHHAALMVLSTIATVAPQNVLLSIMPVFTFMGASILRQDDNYSFHVIEQTMQTIVPALIQKAGGANIEQLKPVMEVFVKALPHIPEHRRLHLFELLVQTMGAEDHLGSIIALILTENVIIQKSVGLQLNDWIDATAFCLSILHSFTFAEQLNSFISLLNLQGELPLEKRKHSSVLVDETADYSTVRRLKLQIVHFVALALQSKRFIALSESEMCDDEANGLFYRSFETLLAGAEDANTFLIAVRDRPMSSDAKVGRALYSALEQSLNAANDLLNLVSFASVIEKLLSNDKESVVERALKLLKQKLQNLQEENGDILMGMVDKLSNVLKRESNTDVKALALECLSLIAAREKMPEKFQSVLGVVISKDCLSSNDDVVVSASMDCIGSICTNIGPRAIPFLPRFAPVVVDIGVKIVSADVATMSESRISVLHSIFGVFSILLETIPQFSGPYLPSLVLITTSSSIDKLSDRPQKLVQGIHSRLSNHVPLQTMLSVISKHLPIAISSGGFATMSTFKLLSSVITAAPSSALSDSSKALLAIFMTGFDYRSPTTCSKKQNSRNKGIEDSVLSAFVTLTMKTNEAIFRPMYLKLVDWATSPSAEDLGWTSEMIQARRLMIYRFVGRLFSSLRSIFIPYFAHLLDDTLHTLQKCKEETSNIEIWRFALQNLHSCFVHHGPNDFITADRIANIVPQLVSQIEVEDLCVDYKREMTQNVVPCLSQLAVSFRDEQTWKAIVKNVLALTRSPSAAIRWTCVKTLDEMYGRLGEEMLVHFPESIPFMAELMEDDDEYVEQACQELCQTIQTYLGEPIQQYFVSS